VHFDTIINRTLPKSSLRPDSIFRIASMTCRRWPCDDAALGTRRGSQRSGVEIPEFANLQVKKPGGGTEPQRSPMTMAQLMSHSAGFGVSAGYEESNLAATDLQGMIDKLKTLPLETQPGTNWDYGPSVNIQGYIIEKLSGQSLDVYFDDIFRPLAMVDTGLDATGESSRRRHPHYDNAGRSRT
jgi:CubicO group peptidase (beta-lactamase class C family)